MKSTLINSLYIALFICFLFSTESKAQCPAHSGNFPTTGTAMYANSSYVISSTSLNINQINSIGHFQDQFPNVKHWSGTICVTGDIIDLSFLDGFKYINKLRICNSKIDTLILPGSLMEVNDLTVQSNDFLELYDVVDNSSINFNNISFLKNNNPNFKAIKLSSSGVQINVANKILISQNENIDTLDLTGIDRLRDLFIRNNQNLDSIDARGLKVISRILSITDNPKLVNLNYFCDLEQIGGELVLGIPTYVQYFLDIRRNTELINCCCLIDVPLKFDLLAGQNIAKFGNNEPTGNCNSLQSLFCQCPFP